MDTTTLRGLLTADRPVVSVYFEDSHDTEDAEKQLELKWRELHERLAEQNAPEDTVKALENAVTDTERPAGTSGRALLATGSEVVADHWFSSPPEATVARVSDLPYLLPLARYGEPGPTHVVALVDHVGADFTVYDGYRRELEEQTVEGSDHPVHKTRGGGFAHRDLQSHTEETVRHNLDSVAEALAKLAQRTGAGLVVIAGEVQARRALHNALPEQTRRIATEINTGARAEGVKSEELTREIDELVTASVRERQRDAIERFQAEIGRDTGLAVQGLQAVTTALHEGNVATLLVGNPGDTTVFGAEGEPAMVAAQREELEAYGVSGAVERRADEAVPSAAVAVDANLVHVGDELALDEGFGALLRHD